MDQAKQKFTFNQPTEEETKTKKLRHEDNQSITTIEDLPNEFFFEAFDYLNFYQIFKGFSKLNHRFDELLSSSSLLLKVEINLPEQDEMSMIDYRRFINMNRRKIFSLKFWLR
ncbi:unnamed protein product [Rotaria sp. Silwood2]|nr:unnamed protein product [Rotaria sp. Silwood2]CAF3092251.1 unnamed protein product [Rotaria sp. Silwood2]CAF3389302.1 unnamed protein product [Rotaria sp. Silwood2]CAF4153999.1 unnamed protein product [Rotaria sp. Silwood2]CAF4499645.1 unnamed protein product [Rotaria sp. Silwood2]